MRRWDESAGSSGMHDGIRSNELARVGVVARVEGGERADIVHMHLTRCEFDKLTRRLRMATADGKDHSWGGCFVGPEGEQLMINGVLDGSA